MLLALCSKNNEEDVRGDLRGPSGNAAAPGLISRRGASTGSPRAPTWRRWPRTGARARQLHPGGRQRQGMHGGAGRQPRSVGAGAARASRRDSRSSWSTCGPSTGPASPKKTAAGRSYMRSARSGRGRRTSSASLEEFLASLNWRSRSRPWSRARWSGWRNSPSAPTR